MSHPSHRLNLRRRSDLVLSRRSLGLASRGGNAGARSRGSDSGGRGGSASGRANAGRESTTTTGESASGETRREATGRGATGATTTRAASVGVSNAAALVEGSGGRNGAGEGGVDAEADPAEQTLGDGRAEVDVVDDGVADLRALLEEHVLGVEGVRLGVGVVDGLGLDFGDEVLVEVDLADVRGRVGLDRVVGEHGRVDVHHDVDMVGATGVVTREEGFELGDAVGVGLLETAEEGGVQVGGVTVAVPAGGDAGVDACGVAVWRWSVSLSVRLGKGVCEMGGGRGEKTYARSQGRRWERARRSRHRRPGGREQDRHRPGPQ